MDRQPADARKVLEFWMQWERGETPPGRTIASMKTHGVRELLEKLVEEST